MKQLKPITEISNEDLLDLLKDSAPNSHLFEYSNDVLDFMSIYGIKSGIHKVQTRLIHKLYSKWSTNPLTIRQFALQLSLVLPRENNILLLNRERDFFLEKIIKKKMNKTKRKQWLKHFQKFIDQFKLKSGRFYTKDIVLYNIYDKWTYKNNNRNPLSFYQFIKFCKLFFLKSKQINGHDWFAMDSGIKNYLTSDLINLMRKR